MIGLKQVGLTIVFALIVGCAQYDNEAGKSMVGADFRGVIKDTLVNIEMCATQVQGDINKISSSTLVLGRESGFTAKMILQFGKFTTLTDTAVIADTNRTDLNSTVVLDTVLWNSADLSFLHTGFIGEDSTTLVSTQRFKVNRIHNAIDPVEFAYSTTQDTDFVFSYLTSDTIETYSDTETERTDVLLPIDSLYMDDILYDLIDESYESNINTLTFFLEPEDDANLLSKITSRFGSSQDVIPLLNINATYLFRDTLDAIITIDTTISIAATFSTYIVNDSLDFPSNTDLKNDRIYVGQGYSRRMLIYSDFSDVVSDMNSINKVELWMYSDYDSEYKYGDADQLEIFYSNNEWTANPDSAELNLAYIPAYLSVTEDEPDAVVDMTSYFRVWHATPESNTGLILRALSETRLIGRSVFYGNSSAVPDSLKPKFRIIYTEYNKP